MSYGSHFVTKSNDATIDISLQYESRKSKLAPQLEPQGANKGANIDGNGPNTDSKTVQRSSKGAHAEKHLFSMIPRVPFGSHLVHKRIKTII